MNDITIEQLRLPASLDDGTEAARLYLEYVDVGNAVARDQAGGSDDFGQTPREALGRAKGNTSVRQHRHLALIDNHVVGVGAVDASLHEETGPAQVDLYVHPAFRRRGVGRALLAAVDETLRVEGRRATHNWTLHPDAPGEVRTAATGWGHVPAEADDVRFLEKAGFVLEQVERMSTLQLADDSAAVFRRMLETAQQKATGYRVRAWRGRTPSDQLAALADLHARMSTDVPAGDLDFEPEVWDAQRLADAERNQLDDQGRELLQAVAYDASDIPVAFTIMTLPPGKAVAFQDDTLVHGEHRGHRLGMLVKAANLLQLLETHPERKRVTTWNAEENRHMLDVNEQLGFAAAGFEGAWQRRERWTS